jgi:hypothetical protein
MERTLILDRSGVRPRTPEVSEAFGFGTSVDPDVTAWTDRGLPGYWVVLFNRAAVSHPASGDAASPCDGDVSCCLPSW